MVATDVASRGIGMIQSPHSTPSLSIAIPGRLLCSALLSTLRRLLDCVIAWVLSCSLVISFRLSWICEQACLYSRDFRLQYLLSTVDWHVLDPIKLLSPRFTKPEDLDIGLP